MVAGVALGTAALRAERKHASNKACSNYARARLAKAQPYLPICAALHFKAA
jgi:hypothetical protein